MVTIKGDAPPALPPRPARAATCSSSTSNGQSAIEQSLVRYPSYESPVVLLRRLLQIRAMDDSVLPLRFRYQQPCKSSPRLNATTSSLEIVPDANSQSHTDFLSRVLEVIIPRMIGVNSFGHLLKISYFQSVQKQPGYNIGSALVQSLRSVRAFSCAGLGDASFFNTRFFLRGSKQIAICSLSGRLGLNYLGRRTMSTGGLSGRKSAEELLAWERSLEQQQKQINCEKMLVDCSRLSVTASWKNFGKAHGRLPHHDLLGGLMKFFRENFVTYLLGGIKFGVPSLASGLIILESLKPGEATKLPGTIAAVCNREFKKLQTRLRIRVGLEDDDEHITGPVAPSSPSSVVVIFGGSYPIFTGSVLYGSSSQGASRKANVKLGEGDLKREGKNGQGIGAGN